MKKLSWLSLIVILASLILAACRPAALPSPTAELKAPALEPATPAPKLAWEQKWDSVLAEAKKERRVSIYGSWGPAVRLALAEVFKDKYGIDVELTPFGRGAEVLVRVQTEQRAGVYAADIFGVGATTLLGALKPAGLLGSVRTALILPEVIEPKYWVGDPIIDKDGTTLALVGGVIRTLVYNSDLIKEGEITNYWDLLKPQYKGKITVNDFTVSGAGNAAVYHVFHNLWGEEKTADFLKRLITEQDVVILRDTRIHLESVARGKYAIAVFPTPELPPVFLAAGAPIKLAMVEEDSRITSGAGCLGVPPRFANPNAALVFINWVTSREGQLIFAKAIGSPSLRTDVPSEGADPLLVPVPGVKYYLQTEEEVELRRKTLEWTIGFMKQVKR